MKVASLDVHAFTVPVDGPDGVEQDGTLEWDSTTVIRHQLRGNLPQTFAHSLFLEAAHTLAGAGTQCSLKVKRKPRWVLRHGSGRSVHPMRGGVSEGSAHDDCTDAGPAGQ